jgi:enoyl-CoA hydratase
MLARAPAEEIRVSELVTYSLESAVATLAMDDGKVNSLSPDMLKAINRGLDRAEADRAVVVIAGREARFSAGFDLNVFKQRGPEAHGMLMDGFKLYERLLSFPTPVIAACTGHAIAAGAFLLLSTDVRIGAAGAFKLGANEVAIGMTMPYSAIEVMRQRLNTRFFTRSVLTGELYTPDQAVLAGYLDELKPAAEVVAAAQKLGASYTQLDMKAHAESKKRVRADVLEALHTAIELDDADIRARYG